MILVILIVYCVLLILNFLIMKNKKKQYLVSLKGKKGFKTVYQIYTNDNGTFLILEQCLLGNIEPLMVGQMLKNNKRGLTFATAIFGGKITNHFLSNGEFEKTDSFSR